MNLDVFLETFLIGLAHADIRYCVLRNHEELPHTCSSRDIDILLDPTRYNSVLEILNDIEGVEIAYIHRRYSSAMVFLWGVQRSGGGFSLEIDFIFSFRWRGVRYFDASAVLDNAVIRTSGGTPVRIPSAAHAAAMLILSPLLTYRQIPEKYRQTVFASLSQDGDAIEEVLACCTGASQAKILVKVAHSINPKIGAYARLRLFVSTWSASGENVLRSFYEAGAQIMRDSLIPMIFPPRILIAFLGPDGAGKSTIIERVSAAVHGLCVDQSVRHLRMKVWLTGRRVEARGVVTEPHARSARGKLASIAKIAGWVVGERLYWLIWRPRHPTLLILDRYFDDTLADPARYRLNISGFWLRLCRRLVPRPRRVFVLTADADIILSRKQEVERNALEGILLEYRRMPQADPRIVSIDCSPDVETICTKVNAHILDIFREKYKTPE